MKLQLEFPQFTAEPAGHTLTPATQTPVLTPQSQTSHAIVPPSPDIGLIANFKGQKFQADFPYKPVLQDELQLSSKDSVRVYQVFDDGWCFAQNEGTHAWGMCPRVYLSAIYKKGGSPPSFLVNNLAKDQLVWLCDKDAVPKL